MKEFKCEVCDHNIVVEVVTGVVRRNAIEDLWHHYGKLRMQYGLTQYDQGAADHVWYECGACGHGVTKEELEKLCEY